MSRSSLLLLAMLPLMACATTPVTEPVTPMPVIDGKTINPDVERLGYVDPRYYGMSEAYAKCVNTDAYTPSMLEGCASDEWRLQKVRLADVVDDLFELAARYDHISEATFFISAEQLRSAQASWGRFSRDDCNLRGGRWGSTWGPATSMKCEAESTASRAQQLEDYLLSVRRQLARTFGDGADEVVR